MSGPVMDGDLAAPPAQAAADDEARRREWHRYYAAKRIRHQNLQLELIGKTDARRILEVGPFFGYVTALLVNAGYEVTTLDIQERGFAWPDVRHLIMDLNRPEPARMAGQDLILCCETLEHLWPEAAEAALRAFAASGARWLLVSVPYSGPALYAEMHATAFSLRSLFFLKWKEALRRYVPEAHPLGHKWEAGTRGRSLRAWEATLARAGWRIETRRFTAPTRSVFHLLRRAA